MNLGHTQQLHAEVFKNVPKAKRAKKLAQTVAGCLVFCGGFFLPLLGYPWQVGVCVAGLGGWIASKELVVGYLKLLPAVLKDVRAALKNGNGR